MNSPDTLDSGSQPLAPVARTVSQRAPIEWLKRGFRDYVDTRLRGSFYGLIFVLMGYVISWIYATQWQLTMGLIAGFFLLGPFICCGIYDLSRQHESGEAVSLPKSIVCFLRNPGSLAFFAFILTFVMIIWARVSVILFALFSTTSFPTLKGVLSMIFSLQNFQFLLVWSGVGFVFASLVFAISVISAPLMLDRRADTMVSIFASARALYENPVPMYLWALLIVVIIGLSLLLGFLPLIVTAPLIGHATWHAYRDLLESPAGASP